MSDVILAAAISGGLVALGSALNLWFNHRIEQARLSAQADESAHERADWYRRALFERRLAAVQQGHVWLLELNRLLNQVLTDGKDPDSEEASELLRAATEARDWYDDNALYLYDELPDGSPFVGLTSTARLVARGRHDDAHIWRLHGEASDQLKERARELLAAEARPG